MTDRFHIDAAKDADVLPFDPLPTSLVSTEVGPAIRELATTAAVSASPGFTWGDSGNVRNSYLQNDTVPSDDAGRIATVTGAVRAIAVTSRTPSDASIEIHVRVGAVFTSIVTVTMSNARKEIFILAEPYPAVTAGDELCLFVNNDDAVSNPVVGIIILGSV